MLGRVRAESAGFEEVGDRITDRHPHDELGHAPLQALVEEVVEQGSAVLKPVQIGAQTQVENLPDMRTEGGVFGLDETMDRAVTAVLHHVDVVGRRRDGQDRGEGIVQQEPEPRRGELSLQRWTFGLTSLLAVERFDGAQVLQLRRAHMLVHR